MKKIIIFLLMIVLLAVNSFAFSVLSVDSIRFSSNDPDVNGDAFVITGVENGGSDVVEADFLKDGSKETTERVTISTKYLDYSVHYPFNFAGDVVYNFVELNDYFVFPGRDYQSLCAEDGGDYVFKNKGGYEVFCYKLVEVGRRASIGAGNSKYELSVGVSGQSGTEKLVITEQESSVSSSGRNVFARTEFLGGSVRQLPNPNSEFDVFFSSNGLEYLVSNNIWSDYDENYRRIFREDDFPLIYVEENNKLADEFLNNRKTYSQYDSEIVGDLRSGALVVTPDISKVWQYPVFTLKMDAEWVGIRRDVGKPKILSFEIQDFSEGVDGKAIIKVRNEGGSSSFGFNLDCDSFVSPESVSKVPFDAGEEKTVMVSISGESDAKTCGVCNVEVFDVNNPGVSDFDDESFCVSTASQCDVLGERICLNDNVVECVEKDGAQVFETDSVCEEGCEVVNGEAKCKRVIQGGDNGAGGDVFVVFWISLVISVFVSLVMGGLSALYLPRFRGKFGVVIIIKVVSFVVLFLLLFTVVSQIVGFSGVGFWSNLLLWS